MSKKILTIDFSLTGSAFIWGNIRQENIDYAYFSDKKKDYENNPHCQKLLKEFSSEDKLDYIITFYINLLDKEKIDCVFLEAPSYNSINTNDSFKEGYGLLKYFARQEGIKYLLIPPITSKLYFTGNARAEKIDMVNQANRQFGNLIDYFEFASKKHQEDIADALSLYSLSKDYFNSDIEKQNNTAYFKELLPYRKMVIAKMYGRDDLYKLADKERKQMGF